MNRMDTYPPRRPAAQAPRRRPQGTRPFSYFELLLAGRYLRARRQEGWISVVTIFSVLGITLGVATLIIVMSVMNGFRHDLLGRLLGYAGHIVVSSATGQLKDYDAVAERLKTVPDVLSSVPVIDAQAGMTSRANRPARWCRARSWSARTISSSSWRA